MNNIVHRAEQIYRDGLILMEYKYYANALACFEQVINLKPDFAQAWFQVGRCHSRLYRHISRLHAFEGLKAITSVGKLTMDHQIGRLHSVR